ncbi:MAG: hypothetical protein NTY31_03975, partial [Candidatus Falkowbacteria bacterium]|nr:hypothetical protein [Candidatus Falkowbacteria bacterium]
LLPAANLEYGASYYITVNGNVQDYDDGDALVSTWTVGNKTSHHFHTIAQPTGALSVDNIRQVRFWGIPAGGYANGWEWVMYATIPTDANHFHLKFADWNSGGNTLPVFSNATSNMKYWSEQITAGLIGSESNPVLITAASTYPADIVLNTDDNTSTDSPGMQTNIHIQVQIPSGQASGSYSTSYGLEN